MGNAQAKLTSSVIILSLLVQVFPAFSGRGNFRVQPCEQRFKNQRARQKDFYSSQNVGGRKQPNKNNRKANKRGDPQAMPRFSPSDELWFDLLQENKDNYTCKEARQVFSGIPAKAFLLLTFLSLLQRAGGTLVPPSPTPSGDLFHPLLPEVFRLGEVGRPCGYERYAHNAFEAFQDDRRKISFISLVPNITSEERGGIRAEFGKRAIPFPQFKRSVLEKPDDGFFALSEDPGDPCGIYMMGINDQRVLATQYNRDGPDEGGFLTMREYWVKNAIRSVPKTNQTASIEMPQDSLCGYVKLSKSFGGIKGHYTYGDWVGREGVSKTAFSRLIDREGDPLLIAVQTGTNKTPFGQRTDFYLKDEGGYTLLETQPGRQLKELPEKAKAYLESLETLFAQTVSGNVPLATNEPTQTETSSLSAHFETEGEDTTPLFSTRPDASLNQTVGGSTLTDLAETTTSNHSPFPTRTLLITGGSFLGAGLLGGAAFLMWKIRKASKFDLIRRILNLGTAGSAQAGEERIGLQESGSEDVEASV